MSAQKRKQAREGAPSVISAMLRLEGLRALAASLNHIGVALAAAQSVEDDEERSARIDELLQGVKTTLDQVNRDLTYNEPNRSGITLSLRSRQLPAPDGCEDTGVDEA